MILAAGYGTRLRPVTFTIPKPMIPICNRPLIGWAAESLHAYGIRDFVVNLHYLPEPIRRYLPAAFSDAHFEFSFEPQILGTGGGLRKVRPSLEREEDFFLVNADTLQSPPFAALLRARREGNAVAALTLRHPPADDHFTPVYFENGRVTGFGHGTGEPLMFSGSHLLSSRIFRYLPDKDFSSIVDEVYQPLLDGGRETIAAVVDDGPWFDIGTPRRYLSASRAFCGSDSVAGERSVVEGTLRDSVVWNDCRIGAGVLLESCVVAHGVTLDRPGTLRNMLICRDDRAIPRDFDARFENGLVLAPVS